MASAPNVDGIVDIRSYAILQDVYYNQFDCAKGSTVAAVRGPFYRQFTNIVMTGGGNNTKSEGIEPGATESSTSAPQRGKPHPMPFFQSEAYPIKPPTHFDTHRSWLCCFCSVAVVFVIFGTLFSYGILQRQIQLTYNLSAIQSVIMGAASFALFILIGPYATHVIKKIGFRSTAIFGLLLVFLGLLLEGFISNVMIFYVSRLFLLPIGGGLAYTSSHYMSSFFEEHILWAVLILCSSSILGVLAYSWFAVAMQTVMDYKSINIIFALIILLLMGVTHTFPMKLTKSNLNSARNQLIKRCIKKNVRKEVLRRAGKEAISQNPDSTAELKSCLCVCVCDMSTICDRGFFLWAGITMLATTTCAVPYLFLYHFHSRLTLITLNHSLLKLIFAFCIPNVLARIYLLVSSNQTFLHNRTVFQLALAGTGIIMSIFSKVNSYGWLAVWMMGMGLFQGLLNVTIPRVTLQTVQREWLKRAWIIIVIMDAIGSFAGPVVIILLRFNRFTEEFRFPCVIIGILQLLGTLLCFLIPNDEDRFIVGTDTKADENAVVENESDNTNNLTAPPRPMMSKMAITSSVKRSSYLEGITTPLESLRTVPVGSSNDYTSFKSFDNDNVFNSNRISCECEGSGTPSNYSSHCPVCTKFTPLSPNLS